MLELFKQIRWQDVVDIVVVAVVLYRVLLIVRGTKAAQMMIGLGVLVVASFFAKYFQLYTMDWIIQSFWSQVVIVLIVLFQPEIRRTLAQMGQSSFFQNLTVAEELKSLEEIVRASIALGAQEHWGFDCH